MNEVKVEMRGQLLERGRTVKCLGVFLDIGLTWNDHIEYVRKKCFAGLGKLKKWSGVLPSRTKKQIYNALVLPYLDYCSVVLQECSVFEAEVGKSSELWKENYIVKTSENS